MAHGADSGKPPGPSRQGNQRAPQPGESRLRELLDPAVRARALYLEEARLVENGARVSIDVVVDLPQTQTGGVTLDQISEVSQDISTLLDGSEFDGDRPYDLQVSSPGANRPLTEPRHWRRATGRMIRVHPAEGEPFSARLLEVHDDVVTLRTERQVKKGMKPKYGEPVEWRVAQFDKATVEVEFSTPAAAFAPTDHTSAEEA